jgi:short-subunit dehydrogenase
MSLHAQGVAVVTGASSGIGAAYAERLARRGYDLTIVDRNRKRLDALAARISDDTGRAVEVFVADLGKLEDLARIETTLKQDASVTMLVNNAGIGAVTPLLQSNAGVMEEMIKLNVVALTRLTYAIASTFVARGHGTIINISSLAAIAPEIVNGVYGATKAYVLAFSQSLHHELADKGIRVQVVMPGATSIEFCQTEGTPRASRPAEKVMPAADVVGAALAGLDVGELVTIPSLRDIADWDALEAARRKLAPNLSRAHAAARYRPSTKTDTSTRH